MPEHQQTQQSKKSDTTFQKQATPATPTNVSNPYYIIQRARINPKSLTHADVMQLQRTIGNRAVGRLLSGIRNNSTAQQTTVQRQEIPEEEEPLQGKMAETIQRQEIPEEEESLQGKMIGTIQRQEIPEEEEPLQGKFESEPEEETCPSCMQRQEVPEEKEPLQGKMVETIQRQEMPEEEEPFLTKRENNTGMPDNLKAGVESLSGIDMSDVRVHYNSSKPAEVGALAYTQGTDIHVAPGQERHLPHETWHVVQQNQGRVRPTFQMKGVPVNNDEGLEHEADEMGNLATQQRDSENDIPMTLQRSGGALQRHHTIIQRVITVKNVDYDPNGNHWRNGEIKEKAFYEALKESIKGSKDFSQAHKNYLQNVIVAVSEQNFIQPDIKALTEQIAQAVSTQYASKGMPITAANPLYDLLKLLVQEKLVANIIVNEQLKMDKKEAGAFDAVMNAVGVIPSRAKGVPSTIPYANLPPSVGPNVGACLDAIRDEQRKWTVAALTPKLTLPNGAFGQMVCSSLSEHHYQGNHTNNAGWLPAVNTPVNRVSEIALAIYNQASQNLKKLLEGEKLDIARDSLESLQKEYKDLRTEKLSNLNDNDVKLSAMAALCQEVSAYIEFSMPGGISRLVYEPGNNKVYITAHYKWREGYNPFFEVLDFPPL